MSYRKHGVNPIAAWAAEVIVLAQGGWAVAGGGGTD